jgi:hypothetical protein
VDEGSEDYPHRKQTWVLYLNPAVIIQKQSGALKGLKIYPCRSIPVTLVEGIFLYIRRKS